MVTSDKTGDIDPISAQCLSNVLLSLSLSLSLSSCRVLLFVHSCVDRIVLSAPYSSG